ncbi:MAG: DUF1573 domain-containing protein [Thermoguttaceae bacterium]
MESNLSWLCKSHLALALLLTATPVAWGQKWATDMFDHASHDFGTVARGAKVEHRFKIENKYVEDVHIKSVRTGCPCTTAKVTQQTLKTWDGSAIVATVDTRGYLGRRDATITVVFDRPFPAEVQLQVHCNIRGDVVVQEGSVQFGSVLQGTAMQQHVSINYAGRNDWKILSVESPDPNLAAQAQQTSRGGGQVDYDLSVTLKDGAPAGYLHEDLILVTDDLDPQRKRVPVPVEAMIQPAISVAPSPLLMGSVGAGETVRRQLIVHGNTAFRIVAAESSDKRFQCLPPQGVNTLHRLPVRFTATGKDPAGPVSTKIRIETDSKAGRILEVGASVEVLAGPPPVHASIPPADLQPPLGPLPEF